MAETDTGAGSAAEVDSYNSDIVATESTPAEVEATTEQVVETPEPVKEETEIPKLKIKFNHEEKEITLDEAKELAQKGMNYDKAIAKAQQDSRDAYIVEQNYEWNGKPITTEADYKQALKEQQMREQYKELPADVQDELIKSKQFREQYETEQQSRQTETAKQADQVAFLTWFKEQNGKDFDGSKDTISPEVWQDNANGIPLIAAYSKHENAALRARIKQLEHNSEVAQKAPVGAVTAHGSAEVAEEDPFMKGFNSVK